jgi:OmpA-OmpF porin, OOP family
MLSGRVVDNSGNPIDDAQVTVVDLNNNQVVATDETNNGMYNVKVNTPGRYSVTADAPGYLFGSALFEVDKDGRILKSTGDIKLSPSADGRVRLLVFFDFDKATLQSASYPELNRAVALMKSNPNMQVEIAGFTDAQGTDAYNKDLSQRRANSVREYLVRQGIEANRLTAMGYGEANPVASNDTEDGRAENRRVEFVVRKR